MKLRLKGSKIKGNGRSTRCYTINNQHTGKKRWLKKRNIVLKIRTGYGWQPWAIYAEGILCSYWKKRGSNKQILRKKVTGTW